MDVLVKVTLPGDIYRFYAGASTHIAGSNPEDILSDALTAYARLLKPSPHPIDEGENSSTSKSR